MTHWTRHASRLDRDLGRKRFADAGYAMEELVAEIGAAFLCADLGITPETRDDHAAYIESWLGSVSSSLFAAFVSNDSVSLACVGHLPGHGSLRGRRMAAA
jgi:antirestriction protein ArdC